MQLTLKKNMLQISPATPVMFSKPSTDCSQVECRCRSGNELSLPDNFFNLRENCTKRLPFKNSEHQTLFKVLFIPCSNI